jgi:hypothetical protein
MPVTASIDGPGKSAGKQAVDQAAPGSAVRSPFPDDEATKLLREIQRLRVQPVAGDVEQSRAARKERNERIVEMATNVLRLTMNEPDRKPQFHQAIGQLLEARFQNALAGGQEEVDLLYADVAALNDRDPKSVAAAEGVYYMARFAQTKAGLMGRSQPEWFETLSRWAREFSERFPEQQQRAAGLLFGAARSAELQAVAGIDSELAARLMTESKLCYNALAEKFPKTEQGQEATASLRRLALPGQTLSQFSGPTADGGFVTADEFPGKVTVVYFWESEDEDFAGSLLPVLQSLREQIPSSQLRMVGVALDDDESMMNGFLEQHAVPGQQIWFADAEQRSWNSPLIRFWGIANTPSVWLVDSAGVVRSTSVRPSELTAAVQQFVR